MSWVTNVILSVGIRDSATKDEQVKKLELINKYFEAEGQTGLVDIDDPKLPEHWYGGDKNMEATLFLGGCDFLSIDSFVEYLKTIPWKEPRNVQLILKDQEEERFRIINLAEPPEET